MILTLLKNIFGFVKEFVKTFVIDIMVGFMLKPTGL